VNGVGPRPLHGRGFTDDVLWVNRVGADPGRSILSRPRGLPRRAC
jgi:hypothetical protein